jgi:hypothetical protein
MTPFSVLQDTMNEPAGILESQIQTRILLVANRIVQFVAAK